MIVGFISTSLTGCRPSDFVPHISVKLTQLGLAIEEALARRHLETIGKWTARHHNLCALI